MARDNGLLRMGLAFIVAVALIVLIGWFRGVPGEDIDHVPSSEAASTAAATE